MEETIIKNRNIDLKFNLEEALIRIAEVERDMDDLIYVNHEIMILFGIQANAVLTDRVDKKTVFKTIKTNMISAVMDPDGFGSMFSHFAPDAIRIGEKYHERALALSFERRQMFRATKMKQLGQ